MSGPENELNILGLNLGDVIEDVSLKSSNKGDEKLIPLCDWVSPEDIKTDEKILKHPIFETAFQQILETWKPKHNIAFMSLCTAQRPYSKSNKYKEFTKRFGDKVDFIVTSSGGLIPPEYWSSFPYLTYDGDAIHGDEWEVLYQQIQRDRVQRFFRTFDYDYVVANFRPNLRNVTPIREGLQQVKDESHIKDFIIIPNVELYEKAKIDGFRGEDVIRRKEQAKASGRQLTFDELKPNGSGAIFPDLHKFVIETLEGQVNKWTDVEDISSHLF